ncbi:MAG TPA: flavin reductase family protein [Longimicrobiaceae bacterium]
MVRPNRRPIQASIRTSSAESGGDFAGLMREALSHWASGVAVLAASDGEEIDAITVSAFASLSLEPPLVLACVGEHASILPMLREEQRFVVSILSAAQQHAAGTVAQRLPGMTELFQSLERPVVIDAPAALECALWEEYAGGDHRIIVGRVESVTLGPEAPPLLYHRRQYQSLT